GEKSRIETSFLERDGSTRLVAGAPLRETGGRVTVRCRRASIAFLETLDIPGAARWPGQDPGGGFPCGCVSFVPSGSVGFWHSWPSPSPRRRRGRSRASCAA